MACKEESRSRGYKETEAVCCITSRFSAGGLIRPGSHAPEIAKEFAFFGGVP